MIVAYYIEVIYIVENTYIVVVWNENMLLAGNYLFKVTNRNFRPMCEICSKFTIKTQNGVNNCCAITPCLE